MPERDLLDAIATELGVEPSFVEKDWHATQMIAAVAEAEYVGLQPVFSGGTSLSKGYGLIQRFSEDLDFKLLLPGDDIDRQTRRGYRSAVIGAIRAHDAWTIDDGDVLIGNQSRLPTTAVLTWFVLAVLGTNNDCLTDRRPDQPSASCWGGLFFSLPPTNVSSTSTGPVMAVGESDHASRNRWAMK